MATTFADLEARVRGLESRSQRAEEDITAIITTVVATGEDVAWLKQKVGWLEQAVQALLDHHGVRVEGSDGRDAAG